MVVSRGLQRLCDIRQAEEEQSRTAMESAIAELQQMVIALMQIRERGRRARVLVASSVQAGEVVDRIAGLEEIQSSHRIAKTLTSKIDAAENKVKEKRQRFLDKRIERRQVETVCEAMKAKAATQANRKNQLELDDWHRSQRNRNPRDANITPD